MWTLLTGPHRPTAVMAHSDDLAIGALRAAKELGVVVPQALSRVGCDDGPAAVASDLTTVRAAVPRVRCDRSARVTQDGQCKGPIAECDSLASRDGRTIDHSRARRRQELYPHSDGQFRGEFPVSRLL